MKSHSQSTKRKTDQQKGKKTGIPLVFRRKKQIRQPESIPHFIGDQQKEKYPIKKCQQIMLEMMSQQNQRKKDPYELKGTRGNIPECSHNPNITN
jgi:hypothetical protein